MPELPIRGGVRQPFLPAVRGADGNRRLFAPPGWAESALVICRLKKGDREKAEKTLAEMLEDRKKLPVSATCLAEGFAALGDLDSAFEWLETAVRERDNMAIVIPLIADCFVPELARDPRFGAFLDRLGLQR